MPGSLRYLVDQDNKPVNPEIRIAVETACDRAFVNIEIWTKRILPLWRKLPPWACQSGWPKFNHRGDMPSQCCCRTAFTSTADPAGPSLVNAARRVQGRLIHPPSGLQFHIP
jgi:hypothetical protein